MPRKRHTAEQIIGLLRQAEVALAQGRTVGEICRELGVSEASFYRWRAEYGGLKVDQARRLKDLERENARLKRAVAELTLDKLILMYRTRFPGHAVALCGALEAGVEASGARVERAEVAVLLDQPLGVVAGGEVADCVADLVDGLEVLNAAES
jgi:transposase-like protein